MAPTRNVPTQGAQLKLMQSHTVISRYRFFILLNALILLLLVTPVVQLLGLETHPQLAPTVLTVIFAVMLCSAAFAVSRRRRTAIVAVSLAVPALFLQGLHLVLESGGVEIAKDTLSIVFLAYTILVILKFIFSGERITFDMICASLCVYVLLGVLWAIVYSLLEIANPGSFALSLVAPDEAVSIRFGGERTVIAIYYSFVTLTTLGYGDIVPSSSSARMFAIVEAITGQLYLVVLVARLVALHIIHTSGGNHGSHKEDQP